ncbi:RagB/SusD family nutrient uptake outer membrane protein [Pedobacter sp.]
MNKHKNTISKFCLLLGLMASSCQKFLAVKSDQKLVVPQNITDIQGLLDDAATMNLRTTPSYGETASDDYFLTPAAIAPLAVYSNAYIWQPMDYRFQNDWSAGYLAIYNANLALELLEKVDRTTGNAQGWDNAKGSALFFRAFYELALTTQFGLAYDMQSSQNDLGIVLRRSSDFNVRSKRSTVAECYSAILKDLQEAVLLLPDHPQHVLRPSKAAAHALLARTHLYMRDYPSALSATEKALHIKSALMDYNSDTDIYSLTVAVPFKPFNREIIFYTEMFSGFGLHISNRATIVPELYNSYQSDDLRRTAYFLATGTNQRFKGSYASHATALFTGLATDELHLNKAECLAHAGQVSEAMEVLNTLLKKRWRNTVSYPSLAATDRNDALQKVRDERRKTLIMRGLRWMDLKRWNREGADITLSRTYDGTTYTLAPNSPRYALPIPADVIEQSGISQN